MSWGGGEEVRGGLHEGCTVQNAMRRDADTQIKSDKKMKKEKKKNKQTPRDTFNGPSRRFLTNKLKSQAEVC